ncbi:MAG: carboxynorspermidine decarboxylase, partial [Sulfurimonas sp.]
VCDEALLEQNLKILDRVQQESGARIILALKGFAMHGTFALIKKYLHGCTASGLHEAMLAHEKMGGEVHTYSPAFKENEIAKIAEISDHIVFNSPAQLQRYGVHVKQVNPDIAISLRVNPECSASPAELYNPCAPFSRLGTTLANFDPSVLPYLDGLNFHALCEEDVGALERVLEAFEKQFGIYLKHLRYVNFGGGHLITKAGYDVARLIDVIKTFKARYHPIDVYLEPGEAIGWQCGFLMTTVLDIVDNGMKIAILDTSAEAHMPDTLAMPYRADVRGAGKPGEKPYVYRLSGNTCLAGDIMGDYAFDTPIHVGDTIIFEDQIHYTFVKNTTFNGIQLPSLALIKKEGTVEILKTFGYDTYRDRLS